MTTSDPILRLMAEAILTLMKKDRIMSAKTDELAAAVADIQNNVVPAVASKIDEIMAALANAQSGAGTIEDPAAIDNAIAALQVVKADLMGKVSGAVVS
jgi:hypothetical protein